MMSVAGVRIKEVKIIFIIRVQKKNGLERKKFLNEKERKTPRTRTMMSPVRFARASPQSGTLVCVVCVASVKQKLLTVTGRGRMNELKTHKHCFNCGMSKSEVTKHNYSCMKNRRHQWKKNKNVEEEDTERCVYMVNPSTTGKYRCFFGCVEGEKYCTRHLEIIKKRNEKIKKI